MSGIDRNLPGVAAQYQFYDAWFESRSDDVLQRQIDHDQNHYHLEVAELTLRKALKKAADVVFRSNDGYPVSRALVTGLIRHLQDQYWEEDEGKPNCCTGEVCDHAAEPPPEKPDDPDEPCSPKGTATMGDVYKDELREWRERKLVYGIIQQLKAAVAEHDEAVAQEVWDRFEAQAGREQS